jgi:hypothetical protein
VLHTVAWKIGLQITVLHSQKSFSSDREFSDLTRSCPGFNKISEMFDFDF